MGLPGDLNEPHGSARDPDQDAAQAVDDIRTVCYAMAVTRPERAGCQPCPQRTIFSQTLQLPRIGILWFLFGGT